MCHTYVCPYISVCPYICVLPCICLCAIPMCAHIHVCSSICVCVVCVCLYIYAHAIHMCMEAEKSHGLLCATWRTKKASSVIWSQSEDPRTRSSGARGQETMDIPVHAESAFALPLPSYSVQILSGWDEAHPPWGWHLSVLSLLIQMLISCRNTLTDTPKIKFTSHLGIHEPRQIDT